MLPWKTLIQIQPSSDVPVYRQIANAIIKTIKDGVLKPDEKMPGTRQLSQFIKVHRQTVVRAYDDLYAQGWLISNRSKGTYTNHQLPEVKPIKLSEQKTAKTISAKTGYKIEEDDNLKYPTKSLRTMTGFHDGVDVRLMPVEAYARAYRSALLRKSGRHHFSYNDVEGNLRFRKTLSDYLNSTRGLSTQVENIFLTRGSTMGIYLVTRIAVRPNDNIIVGDTNYSYSDRVFIDAHANVLRVKVDDEGIDVDEIEALCRKKKIRAVYVTSHHHYPTTVTLSAGRRMKLLATAERYGFMILEDDYDYEFHYQSSPILPIASADRNGMVIYVGTLSKTMAPALRLGYVVAPENLVRELVKLRHIIDVQGDPFQEEAMVELFEQGEIRRHMKKMLNIYRQRRDNVCKYLVEELSDYIKFKTPEGGLAVWAKFDKRIPLPDLNLRMREKGTIISNGLIHNTGSKKLNCTRMGFGWMNEREADKALSTLRDTIKKF
jgi:GntR family transcriptional regulator / MocR family aminotransferase